MITLVEDLLPGDEFTGKDGRAWRVLEAHASSGIKVHNEELGTILARPPVRQPVTVTNRDDSITLAQAIVNFISTGLSLEMVGEE